MSVIAETRIITREDHVLNYHIKDKDKKILKIHVTSRKHHTYPNT